jgi:hypothetical protein
MLRRIISVIGGPRGTAVATGTGKVEYGELVVDVDGAVRFQPAEEAAAPEGSRAEGEEVGTPGADPTG